MTKYRPGAVLQRAFRSKLPSRVYDRNAGWIFGNRLCRLTHVGRKSGKTYRTVLEVIEVDPATGEVVLISGLGPKADWYRNVRAAGTAELEIGRRRFSATVREIDTEEAVRIFTRYERRYRLIAPVVRHLLGKLVGGPYDGSAAARRDLVERLPMVAFDPR